MKNEIEIIKPEDIEKRSFEVIQSELTKPLDPVAAPVIKRVIHATADFEYADSLYFSDNAVDTAVTALKNGVRIITDTNMAKAGINKAALSSLGCEALCYMADPDVSEAARACSTTRAAAAVNKAASLSGRLIFVFGNAPTALIQLCRLINEGSIYPALVIGAPVGFVNVVQSKEMLMNTQTPCIVARGRKGGSNVAAAIVNALMYMITR